MDGHSSSLLGPRSSTPNSLFIVIRPQGRDHPPCWLCILFYGAEIICSMLSLTNHLFYMAICSDVHHLSWGRDHPPQTIHLSSIRPQGRDHPPCWLCILFYGAEIICSMHRLTNHSFCMAISSDVHHLLGPRSSTPNNSFTIYQTTRP